LFSSVLFPFIILLWDVRPEVRKDLIGIRQHSAIDRHREERRGARQGVVKVLSTPLAVPLLLVATARKWYVVATLKPLMFALTLWYVFPVRVWEAVVSP
jgi:hypothetical protein